MKLKTLATTALTALSIATVPVSASQVRSGYWTIFDTKGDGDNAPLCGMKTDYSNANASIMIKGILGTENLVVHVFKAGWRFPAQGVQLPVTLGFDRGTFGSTTAVGYQRPGLMPVVEFNVARNATKGFLEEFSKANMMWVRFDEGNEQPWQSRCLDLLRALHRPAVRSKLDAALCDDAADPTLCDDAAHAALFDAAQ